MSPFTAYTGLKKERKKPCARAFKVPLHTEKKEKEGKKESDHTISSFPFKISKLFWAEKVGERERTLAVTFPPGFSFCGFHFFLFYRLRLIFHHYFSFFFRRFFLEGEREACRNQRNSEGGRMSALIVRPAATRLLLLPPLNQQSRGGLLFFCKVPTQVQFLATRFVVWLSTNFAQISASLRSYL